MIDITVHGSKAKHALWLHSTIKPWKTFLSPLHIQFTIIPLLRMSLPSQVQECTLYTQYIDQL